MRSSFVAASILLLSAATAQAADLFIPMEPAPAPVYVDDSYDWSGVYFGVQAGGQAVNFESEYGQPGSGALAGIHAGAQTQSAAGHCESAHLARLDSQSRRSDQ